MSVQLLDPAGRHHDLLALLGGQLAEVSLIIERQLASDLPAVNALCRHIERYRGKMLRPTMVLVSGLAASAADDSAELPDARVLNEAHRTVAAVTELIHMATLVHDDVLDEAEIRRRGATINHLHGNETAVMLGDYLISNAFHLCSTVGDPAINLALGRVTNTLCEGELLQLHHRDKYGIDERTYFEIIDRKTASLIGEACRLGAKLSGASDAVIEALGQYGATLGIAFQIQDDLLDVMGEQDVVGKSLGRDLDKGKLTLPLIIALREADAAQRGALLRAIEARETEEIRAVLLATGAAARARETAVELVGRAKAGLTPIAPGSMRDLLETLANTVVERTF